MLEDGPVKLATASRLGKARLRSLSWPSVALRDGASPIVRDSVAPERPAGLRGACALDQHANRRRNRRSGNHPRVAHAPSRARVSKVFHPSQIQDSTQTSRKAYLVSRNPSIISEVASDMALSRPVSGNDMAAKLLIGQQSVVDLPDIDLRLTSHPLRCR